MKSSALATALVASETELKTAISSADALISRANSRFAASTSATQASQSMPRVFHESRYRSAAARVAVVCGACEQLFIGIIVERIGMRRRSADRSYAGARWGRASAEAFSGIP